MKPGWAHMRLQENEVVLRLVPQRIKHGVLRRPKPDLVIRLLKNGVDSLVSEAF